MAIGFGTMAAAKFAKRVATGKPPSGLVNIASAMTLPGTRSGSSLARAHRPRVAISA